LLRIGLILQKPDARTTFLFQLISVAIAMASLSSIGQALEWKLRIMNLSSVL